ncbi:MBL fold metallo-hydrolase [Pseudonocardia sp. RS11V-5]|uniref:MBL fold metallo-hydrolase n=1 Tax=Pseudonocardia terrae TaxID=2905831 RepID=UPI001E61DACB|nr:MBL fold metallo-hydrolase [Pseudonocardia terrae]MCE3553433.1 MBL fold metallo-hydrolase [Pseudonocardia terrae]
MTWIEVGDGVLARRHAELDLTTGLVLGAERALVIDTRGDREQGAELAAAVRAVTPLPVTVVLTHAHFDHCFGTAAFLPAPVLAHPACRAALERTGAVQRERWVAHYRSADARATAEALEATDPVPPDPAPATLDLGGREVVLVAPGPGHTDHDLAVRVPDADVLFAGDLLESGAPPDYEDAHPLSWADAVATLLALHADTYVPGHGDPMTPAQARAQHDELTTVAALARAVAAGELTGAEAQARSPHPGVPWP